MVPESMENGSRGDPKDGLGAHGSGHGLDAPLVPPVHVWEGMIFGYLFEYFVGAQKCM